MTVQCCSYALGIDITVVVIDLKSKCAMNACCTGYIQTLVARDLDDVFAKTNAWMLDAFVCMSIEV